MTDLAVGAEIGGVGLGHPYDRAVQHVIEIDQSDLRELAAGEIDEGAVAHGPQARRPAAQKYSRPSQMVSGSATSAGLQLLKICSRPELDVGLLHVDPVVRRHAVRGVALAGAARMRFTNRPAVMKSR